MFKFFFNWDNIFIVLVSAVGYVIGTSLTKNGFRLISLIIFIVVIFLLNPVSLKVTDYIIRKGGMNNEIN